MEKQREFKEWEQRDKILDDADTPKDESSIELYRAHRNGVSTRDSTRGNYAEVQREWGNGKQLTIMNAAQMLIIERYSAKIIENPHWVRIKLRIVSWWSEYSEQRFLLCMFIMCAESLQLCPTLCDPMDC